MLRVRASSDRIRDRSVKQCLFHTQSIYSAPHSNNQQRDHLSNPRNPPSMRVHSMPPPRVRPPPSVPLPVNFHNQRQAPFSFANRPAVTPPVTPFSQSLSGFRQQIQRPNLQPNTPSPHPARITPIDGPNSNLPASRSSNEHSSQIAPPTLNPFVQQAMNDMKQPYNAVSTPMQKMASLSYKGVNAKVQKTYTRDRNQAPVPRQINPFAAKVDVNSFPELLNTVKQQNDQYTRRAAEIQKNHMARTVDQSRFADKLQSIIRKVKQQNARRTGSTSVATALARNGIGFGESTTMSSMMQADTYSLSDTQASSSRSSFAALKEQEETDVIVEVPVSARQTVGRLAGQMGVRGQDVLAKLAEHGSRAKKVTDFINAEAAEMVVVEFNMMPVRTDLEQKFGATLNSDVYASLPRRGAVICVMGHVDHGKTTLLDTLRRERRALYEAGNITQSIGAFRVDLNLADTPTDTNADSDSSSAELEGLDTIDREAGIATFLDTPGHAAFRAMRERGANSALTDLIVLVVSAVDGIQPQTVEVIELSKQHNVPLIIAINKCDLPDADPARVKEQLCMYDIVPESMGGDILTVDISAKTGEGIQELKESILLASDMLDLRAPREGLANAYVVESRRERGLGCVMNIVVRAGQLKVGDSFVCGFQYGTIRALMDEQGQKVQSAFPGQGVQMLGATNLEDTTEELVSVENEEAAIALVTQRKSLVEVAESEVTTGQLDELSDKPKEAAYKVLAGRGKWRVAVKEATSEENAAASAREASTLYLILKADVRGSLEAMLEYVNKLPTDDVSVQVLRHSLGEITEADVKYAADFNASIIGFNIAASADVQNIARNCKVPLASKEIIYHCMDEIRDQASEKIPVEIEQRVIGQAEILQVFPQRKKRPADPDTVVAGCRVMHGEIKHDQMYRVRRDGELIFQGSLRSMRHVKEEVQLMIKGAECGLMFDTSSTDFMSGDLIECVEDVKQSRLLDDSAARGFETVHNPKYDQYLTPEARDAIVMKKKRQAQELKGASTLVYAPANVKQRVQQAASR